MSFLLLLQPSRMVGFHICLFPSLTAPWRHQLALRIDRVAWPSLWNSRPADLLDPCLPFS